MANEPSSGGRIPLYCVRFGREATTGYAGNVTLVPDEWEGTFHEPVCPGCQLAEWHPHCTSVRWDAGYGERVDLEKLKRSEPVTIQTMDGVPIVLRSLEDAFASKQIGY